MAPCLRNGAGMHAGTVPDPEFEQYFPKMGSDPEVRQLTLLSPPSFWGQSPDEASGKRRSCYLPGTDPSDISLRAASAYGAAFGAVVHCGRFGSLAMSRSASATMRLMRAMLS